MLRRARALGDLRPAPNVTVPSAWTRTVIHVSVVAGTTVWKEGVPWIVGPPTAIESLPGSVPNFSEQAPGCQGGGAMDQDDPGRLVNVNRHG